MGTGTQIHLKHSDLGKSLGPTTHALTRLN